MSIPGGAGTTPQTVFGNSFVLGATGFSHRVGVPTGPSPGAPALRFAPSRCPKPYLTLTPAVLPIIPNRAGIPSTATHPHRDGACCTLFALLDRRVLERNYPER